METEKEKKFDAVMDVLKDFCENTRCDYYAFCDEGKCLFRDGLGGRYPHEYTRCMK